MSFTPRGAPDASDYYDKLETNGDPLHFKKRKGGKHLTGVDLDMIVPSASEVRLLGNRNRQCAYYSVGKSFLLMLSSLYSLFDRC